MTLTLPPDLEKALADLANRQGVAPGELALSILRERLSASLPSLKPRDEWERRLLAVAKDCGVSLPDEALSREELYE